MVAESNGSPAPEAPSQAVPSDGARPRPASGLPVESLPLLLELLDPRSLGSVRCSFHMRELNFEAYMAQLQGAVMELLAETKFPFTHAAYVLGLNGPYYSLDTIAEKHYGIPKTLPALLCALFKASVPSASFTTLRVQKFAAAANFGGQHRTLAFSLSMPPAQEGAEELDIEADREAPSQEAPLEAAEATPLLVSTGPGLPGHVLCLSRGCVGGHGEVCEDYNGDGTWRWLAGPQPRPRWTAFPADAWLRWHWPRVGDLFVVTATCEAVSNCLKLRRRERLQMEKIGFLLPPEARRENDEVSESEEEECPAPPVQPQAAPSSRPSEARVAAAKRLLGLAEEPDLSAAMVEEAFRRSARQVHPDRAQNASPIPTSWLMSQLTWARRILREAVSQGISDLGPQEAAAEILMLAAPHPED